MTWDGKCPADRHGLDYEGQDCDLCHPTHQRDEGKMSEEMTTADSQFVAAFCSTCGGFTMFHAEPTSATASKWARQCKAKGDRIEYRTDTNLGPSCKCERPRPKKRNAKAAQP